jgi:hypothetical protein
VLGLALIDQRVFSMEIRVKKEGSRRFTQKKRVTLILVEKGAQISKLEAWIPQQLISGFFPFISAEKKGYADSCRKRSADF